MAKRKHPRRGRRKKRLPPAESPVAAIRWIEAPALPLAAPDRVQQAISLRHLLTKANRHHA